MNSSRFQSLVHGALLAVIIGWVLYIGKDVWIPIVFGAVVVYVIAGVTDALGRVPRVGRMLPIQLRHALSFLIIGFVLLMFGTLLAANKQTLLAVAPHYQESLLTVIQNGAVWFRIETEPTWTSLREEALARISLPGLLGSMLASLSSIAVSVVVVMLYAIFLLVEQHSFAAKIASISNNPRNVSRISAVIGDINRRIGAYFALKAFISILLGAISWLIMFAFGLEFAAVWAVLVTLLNFVPYIGSVLGLVLPAITAVVQFGDPASIFWLLMLLTMAQFLIGNFLDPYLMGNSLNLSPFAILVSLAIWYELWGIPGAFLAVPITAILVIVFSEFPGSRPIAVLLSRNGRL